MDKNLSLREIREQLNMTQQELADTLKMARAYISAVERGVNPFSEKLRKRVEDLWLSMKEYDVEKKDIEISESRWNEVNLRLKALEKQMAEINALLIKLLAK